MTVHEPQGDEDCWCAIAHTEHGLIPGKARDGECWYGYGGEEHTTEVFKVLKYGHRCNFPQGPAPGEQTDGAGYMWCAVANTEWGKIPGKADKDGKCWYSYGGEEHETEDFVYVCESPNMKKPQGWQNDDAGELWCAVANTEWGRIPGKAKDGTCWYPYGGEEHETDDFEYVKHGGLSEEPVGDAHGEQDDCGEIWCAVAQTEWGRIPGKAKDGACWYSYAGEEHETDNFRYVYSREAKAQGCQEECGELWCALASTDKGAIPGKSDGTTCWYSYGGEEHETDDFVLVKDGGFSSEPVGPAQGIQTDYGKLYCAVANTEWGKVPGKADKNGNCWYPYGGEEHQTDDFMYVYSRRLAGTDPSPREEWNMYSATSASHSASEDEDEEPETSWSGTYHPFNNLMVGLTIGENTITGRGEDCGVPFEVVDGWRNGRDLRFVMALEDGETKYYWGNFDAWNNFIYGKISSEGFDAGIGDRALAHLRKTG